MVALDSGLSGGLAASPAVEALISYAVAEATALLTSNRDILDALVEALIEAGQLSGERVDEIISGCMTARSVTAERQRRAEWKQRESNAAKFSSRARSTPPSSAAR
jgi:hypothetical protein